MHGQKECCVCQQPFVPDPRLKHRQKTCAATACRKELKRQMNKAWREQNPEYFKARYDTTLREWHAKNADYKKQYRQAHPEYVHKNALYVKAHRRKNALRLQET
jgi:hypothetical protein